MHCNCIFIYKQESVQTLLLRLVFMLLLNIYVYRGKSQKKNPPWDLKSCCRKGERCWRDAYSRRLNRRLQQEPEAGKPGMNTSLVCDVWSTNICTTQLLPAFNSSCSDLGTFRRSELWARTAGFQWELSEEGELTKGHSVYLFHVTVLFFVCLFVLYTGIILLVTAGDVFTFCDGLIQLFPVLLRYCSFGNRLTPSTDLMCVLK